MPPTGDRDGAEAADTRAARLRALAQAEVVLVSACLLGEAVRYDGGARASAVVERALAGKRRVTVCPEVLGGLAVPRPAAELRGGDGGAVLAGAARVEVRDGGEDVGDAFRAGAAAALAAARAAGATVAVLKARSPSCGVGATWIDGAVRPGDGVAAAALAAAGIVTLTDEELE